MQTTVISDAVNLAARLEKFTKDHGMPIIISDATRIDLPSDHPFELRPLGEVEVPGRDGAVRIFGVLERTTA